jgi:hypothetical protein
MKKLYALCFLTLAAVALDIVFLHPRSAKAQSNPMVRIERVQFYANGPNSRDVQPQGRVVCFHCVDTAQTRECFVASGGN